MAMRSSTDNWFRPDDFSITVSPGEDGSIAVKLRGEFDLATAADLRERLVDPEVRDAQKVQIDLTRVTFLGSTGIGLLVALCKRIRSTGGTFSVKCREGIALTVLQVSGLIDFLEVENQTEPLSSAGSRFAGPSAG